MSQSTRQGVLFEHAFRKPVAVRFDESALSSDAGLLLLGAADRRMGLTERLGALIPDDRQPGKIDHPLLDLLRQRVYGIAAGYADGNDARTLRGDPILKMLCERDPIDGADLASQPTLSRFERSVDGRTLVRMQRQLEELSVRRLAERHRDARRVVFDLDATEDPTHGQQAFSFFNGYYDSYCFLPLLGFLSVPGTSEQLFCCARLRPGIGASNRGVIPAIRRVVALLRRFLPGARVLVRLDGGFANPLLLRVLDALHVDYVAGLPSNSVLLRKSKAYVRGLRSQARATGVSQRRFGSIAYAARKWDRERRVVVKAEVLVPPATAPERQRKVNMRFVVTNLKSTASHVYETVYCGRGDSENRIKEMKDLQIDRTSCSSFRANQLRVLLASVAYVLYQELRWQSRRTDLAAAQVGTIRLALVKVAARVVKSVRRVVLHLPSACPAAPTWCRLAIHLGAVPG